MQKCILFFIQKYFILLLTKQNISNIIISTNKTKQTESEGEKQNENISITENQ